MPSQFIIYGLVDPNTLKLRYVGLSSSGLKRPNSHTYTYKLYRKDRKTQKYTHCQCWLQQLDKQNQKPTIVILQECASKEELNSAERYWIQHYRELGYDLTNIQDGGYNTRQTGYKHSIETIEKLKKSAKLRYDANPSSLIKAVEVSRSRRRGRPLSQEQVQKREITKKLKGYYRYPAEAIAHTREKQISIVDQYGTKYSSISEAARQINSSSSNICKQLKGISSHVKGYVFNYTESV